MNPMRTVFFMKVGLLRPGFFLSLSSWHDMAAADETIRGV